LQAPNRGWEPFAFLCYNSYIMAKKVPQLLKGFRDFGPVQMEGRLFMLAKIRRAFERFGFSPMETPALEYAETLTGKYGAEEKLMYKFADNGGRNVAMRYDLTVPLARFYAANRNDLPKPFKRYAIGPVWRAENPQAGRYREFYQCDVDAVGSESALSDAESIAAIATALTDLGIKEVSIRVNNRKILDGLLTIVGIPTKKHVAAIRILDKQDKLPEKEVRRLLGEFIASGNQVDQLFEHLGFKAASGKELQDAFLEVEDQNKFLSEGVGELSDVLDALLELGVKGVTVDLKLARGLDYYTGTVCEVSLSKLPEIGSIAGGGRYDNLISDFVGAQTPAVGMSIGIDRLIYALEELNLISYDEKQDVIIFNLDQKFASRYLELATKLRSAGISTDIYYQTEAMDKQFKYAEKKKNNLAIIIGEDEMQKGVATVKNLATRKQSQVKIESLAKEIQLLLK